MTERFGVIGVCGANGNLIARILKERGYEVSGTDLTSLKDCRFSDALEGYDIELYYGETPDEFFEKADYVVPPMSLSKDSAIFRKINKVYELTDLINDLRPDKPVFGITGTNGKTTCTALLKKIAYDNGIRPCEHNLEKMQGNAEYIPILQSRLNGDVAILEVGTFGVPGTVKRTVGLSDIEMGLITNITPDHLGDLGSFMDYAHVKAEFIEGLKGKKLIVNGHDPTVMGLLKELDFDGELITFGVDWTFEKANPKECVCGSEINVKETISGSGYYFCRNCGLTTPQVDYIATNVDLAGRSFDIHTPSGKLEVEMSVDGLHNVYNITGVIIAAHEFLGLPFDKILDSVKTFTGVEGRMEKVAVINDKEIYVDYAHNPAGVQTVLDQFKKLYGDFTCVITVSSESGYEGDLAIFDNALEFSKYVVPASAASQKIAALKIEEDLSLKDKILFDSIDEFEKKGTLGASYDEVKDGLAKALGTECKVIVAIGEAATKFKSCVDDL